MASGFKSHLVFLIHCFIRLAGLKIRIVVGNVVQTSCHCFILETVVRDDRSIMVQVLNALKDGGNCNNIA